jgi:hypothetical protein
MYLLKTQVRLLSWNPRIRSGGLFAFSREQEFPFSSHYTERCSSAPGEMKPVDDTWCTTSTQRIPRPVSRRIPAPSLPPLKPGQTDIPDPDHHYEDSGIEYSPNRLHYFDLTVADGGGEVVDSGHGQMLRPSLWVNAKNAIQPFQEQLSGRHCLQTHYSPAISNLRVTNIPCIAKCRVISSTLGGSTFARLTILCVL